jgi:hypothetical protein
LARLYAFYGKKEGAYEWLNKALGRATKISVVCDLIPHSYAYGRKETFNCY